MFFLLCLYQTAKYFDFIENKILSIQRNLMLQCLAQTLIILSFSLFGMLVWLVLSLLFFYFFLSFSPHIKSPILSLMARWASFLFLIFFASLFAILINRINLECPVCRDFETQHHISLSLSCYLTHSLFLQCSSYGAVTSVSASQVLNSISQSSLHTHVLTHAHTHTRTHTHISLIVISTGLIVIYTPSNPRRKK